jgi:hypothetical protein
MPETAMHENDGVVLWKDKVRLAGKVSMQPKAQACTM